MADLPALKTERKIAKTRITKIRTFLDSLNDVEKSDEITLEVKRSAYNETKRDFYRIQCEIVQQTIEEKAQDAEIEQITDMDEKCLGIEFLFVTALKRIGVKQPNDRDDENSDSFSSTSRNENKMRNLPRLPDLKLPEFSGKFDEWIDFKIQFCSIIKDDETIQDSHKLLYLKGCLKGEAAYVQTAEETFDSLWKALADSYENKRFVIDKHINELLNEKQMNRNSAKDLRRILNCAKKHMRAFSALDLNMDKLSEALFINVLLKKIDQSSRSAFEMPLEPNTLPTWTSLMEFLQKRANSLEAMDIKKDDGNSNEKQDRQSKSFGKPKIFTNFVKDEKKDKNLNNNLDSKIKINSLTCYLCKKSHFLTDCQDFNNLVISDRIKKVIELELCLNCLKKGHGKGECKRAHCPYCGEAHHSRLHLEVSTTTGNSVVHSCVNETKQVLLHTALVYVFDSEGNKHLCRCLLDSGGMSNLMSEHLFQTLKLKKTKIDMTVFGVNGNSTDISCKTEAVVASRLSNFKKKFEFLVINKITGDLPCRSFDLSRLKLPPNMMLADETLNVAGRIDLLLGLGEHKEFFNGRRVDLGEGLPVAESTEFGYVLGGNLKSEVSYSHGLFCGFVSNEELNTGLKRFWELEAVPKQKPLSKEEQEVEEHFLNTTYRLSDGRFGVRLPFNSKIKQLGDSKRVALKRYLKLESRLEGNLELQNDYHKFIQEYIDLGHMELTEEDCSDFGEGYYLPHHAVLKLTSSSTKLRVVFDGSCVTLNGISLNDTMKVGAGVQRDLIRILLRFRLKRFVFGCDIIKMYRQIKVHPKDAIYQKILWRFSKSDPIRIWKLNTVTYGTAAASYCATRTLKLLAELEGQQLPRAADAILNETYMDDCLTGADTLEEALLLRDELIKLLSLGKFQAHKWCSNHEALLQDIPVEKQEIEKTIEDDSGVKTLGVSWMTGSDKFVFSVDVDSEEEQKITKRTVASQIHKYFDPLGITGPVGLFPKLFMQSLWLKGYDWDTELGANEKQFWTEYRSKLKTMKGMKVERFVFSPLQTKSVQIHGFSDASTLGYGACLYVRSEDVSGNVRVSLLMSKSRVAPLAAQTVARLELCAAELLTELWYSVEDSFDFEIEKTVWWSDSKIVLSWIKVCSRQLNVFVSHRVSKIQEMTEISDWRYVPSKENPADVLSRGLMPDKLQECDLWWNGPKFLGEAEPEWPSNEAVVSDSELPEFKTHVHNVVEAVNSSDFFEMFSDFAKLIRIVARCLRFINNIRSKISKLDLKQGDIDGADLLEAKLRMIKLCQHEEFLKEIEDLKRKKAIDKASRLIRLDPFIGDDGLLRMRGRLINADCHYNKKHPILLPPNHLFTILLIRYYHLENMHAGAQVVLNSIRSRHWILQGRNQVRKVILSCIKCFRAKPKKRIEQVMGQLPEERVVASAPFLHAGVDYAGPFYLKVSRNVKTKGYIAVFTCLSTRSVHLELVGDMSSDCFLNALYRFVGRRGVSQTIHSDNGTNFVGAVRKLTELKELFEGDCLKKKLQEYCDMKEITWKFIPPKAPHMGGCWESMVKSVKSLLFHFLSDASLTYEEMLTLLVRIEAILNSRPLTVMTEDPDDLLALTPGHFIIGRPLTELAEPDVTDMKLNRTSRFQYLTRIKQEFWKRWSRDYLNQLQMRFKWHSKVEVRLGQLVVMVEDDVPSSKWILGRIIETHPGKDGVIRVVTVKSIQGKLKRPVNKLVYVPINDYLI